MKNIATDIRALIIERLNESSPAEILRIASGLAANEQIEAISTGHAMRKVAVLDTSIRFVNLDASGKPTTDEHVAVHDRKTGLTWSRALVGTSLTYAEAMKVASTVTLLGHKDWRAPTLEERLSINDYTKHSPALDTAHFANESGWEWTSTVDASSPSVYAWGVNLGYGYSSSFYQSYHFHVRAVRAGQSLSLDL